MARRPNWRAVKQHRSYTAHDAGRLLGVATVTVRRWLKGGLPAITDRKPALITGGDLVDFLTARKPRRQKCGPHQFFCFRCRVPREPAFGAIEVIPLKAANGNMRALCGVCATLMHKRIRLDDLAALRGRSGLTITQACGHLDEQS